MIFDEHLKKVEVSLWKAKNMNHPAFLLTRLLTHEFPRSMTTVKGNRQIYSVYNEITRLITFLSYRWCILQLR